MRGVVLTVGSLGASFFVVWMSIFDINCVGVHSLYALGYTPTGSINPKFVKENLVSHIGISQHFIPAKNLNV